MEEQDIGLERSVIECSRGTGTPSPKYRLFLAEENVLVAWSVEDCKCRIVMGTMKHGAPEVQSREGRATCDLLLD